MKRATFLLPPIFVFLALFFRFAQITSANTCDGSINFASPGVQYQGEVSGNDRVKVDWTATVTSLCCDNVLKDSGFEVKVVIHRAIRKDEAIVKVPLTQRSAIVDVRSGILEGKPRQIDATITLKKVFHVEAGGHASGTLNQTTMKLDNLQFSTNASDTCKQAINPGNLLYNGRLSGDDSFTVFWSAAPPVPGRACAPTVTKIRVNGRVIRLNGKTDSDQVELPGTATLSAIKVPRGVLDKNPASIEVSLLTFADKVFGRTATKSITLPN